MEIFENTMRELYCPKSGRRIMKKYCFGCNLHKGHYKARTKGSYLKIDCGFEISPERRSVRIYELFVGESLYSMVNNITLRGVW